MLLLKFKTSLSLLIKSVASITTPEESFPKDFTSNDCAIGCTFELLTEVNIGAVESFAYSANDTVLKRLCY
jgi:hypothetical protein